MFSMLAARLTPNAGNLKNQDEVSGSESLPFRSVKSLIVHVALLVLASVFFALWINSIQTTCPLGPHLAYYSPVNEVVRYVEKQFDGNMNSTSIFRGSPSSVTDDAWVRVRPDSHLTRLTHKQFLMTGGIDVTAAVQYRPEDGGGYLAQLDSYHHIHCLNMVRKYLRWDYYASDPVFKSDPPPPHLAHCVDMIRQKLMCTVDLTMISYDWVPGVGDPRPNLSATHQCLDYERILDWTAQHDTHVPRDRAVRSVNVTEFPGEPM